MFHVKHGNGLGLIVSRETWKSPFCQNGSTLPVPCLQSCPARLMFTIGLPFNSKSRLPVPVRCPAVLPDKVSGLPGNMVVVALQAGLDRGFMV